MKTRLFVVLFCLVWAFGCGNRDPEDVETGFGQLETATVRVCNNSNCVGGANDEETCVDDFDCPDGSCEILIPFSECFGGSVEPRTPCETAPECGSACDAGPLEGEECNTNSDCKVCEGSGVLPKTLCATADDCGGTCLGGSIATDGAPCFVDQTADRCGGTCVGGFLDGFPCRSDSVCILNEGTECSLEGVECVNTGECVQSGDCVAGECNEVREVCTGASTVLQFDGVWESCLNLDQSITGVTEPASTMRNDGPPVEIEVAGCNTATLDLAFTRASIPEPGCASIVFTSEDRPSIQQCGESVHLEVDFR